MVFLIVANQNSVLCFLLNNLSQMGELVFFIFMTTLLMNLSQQFVLSASRTAIRNDTGGRGGTKTVMGDNMSTKCEPLSHSLENGYIVCDGENVNSTCWTVCLEGYKKEDLLMGSYNCQVNGEWSGEHTTCTPKDCGTPSQVLCFIHLIMSTKQLHGTL